MNAKQSSILRMYINDMLAVEKDLLQATSVQAKDETVGKISEVKALVEEIVRSSESRIRVFEAHSHQHEGKWGAAVKGAVATAAGTLAGIYDKVRKHTVSRMLRDDHVALNLASVAYGMLYTTAVAFEDEEVATTALEALNVTASQVTRLSTLIPGVVVGELTEDGPVNSEAVSLAVEAIEMAWDQAARATEHAAAA